MRKFFKDLLRNFEFFDEHNLYSEKYLYLVSGGLWLVGLVTGLMAYPKIF